MMSELSIWAPAATSVEIETSSGRAPCERRGEQWIADGHFPVGTAYRFVIDGTSVPDPRGRAMPDGVHGWSTVVDPPAAPTELRPPPPADRAFDRAVLYELHVGTFSEPGTFLGAIDHLDHLVRLGVTHIELMPVAAFDGSVGWGYDGVALYAPHPAYGTTADLATLVDACHRRGLALLLDVVYNHLGPSGNYLAVSGPYFTGRYSTPWGDAVNLDGPGSDGVRSFLIDNALYWLEVVGFDGLRLDAVHALYDTSAVPFLEQLRGAVDELGRRTGREFVLIAESDRADPRVVARAPVGTGLDGVWVDDLHHCLHVALTGERLGYYEDYALSDLPTALTSAMVYQGRYSPHRGRTVGRSAEGVDSSSFVVSLQNHDQIGNRAGGERLHHLVGVDRTLAAAALTLLSPFTTMLFQGEEWSASSPFPYFSDHTGELGEAIRTGRLREFAAFGWSASEVAEPQDPTTASSARLRWTETTQPPHCESLEWYRQLISLRSQHPAFAPDALNVPGLTCEMADHVVTVRRGGVAVTANLGDAAATCASTRGDTLLSRGEFERKSSQHRLGPGTVLVTDSG